ncbi:unnamed protein product [Umbelopsis ramanniana]
MHSTIQRKASKGITKPFTKRPAARPRLNKKAENDLPQRFKPAQKTHVTSKAYSGNAFDTFRRRASALATIPHISSKLEQLGITKEMLKPIASGFYRDLIAGKIQGCDKDSINSVHGLVEDRRNLDSYLYTQFLEYAEPHLPKDIASKLTSLKKITDLRFPHEWYPEARRMQRKIHLHVGPTNSGKTYSALKRLTEAKSGIYCGPLRLLAHEIFERMNNNGIACNLVTGEEKRIISEDATLTSSTVEMVELNRDLEVAVVDEIQMIGDRTRGWAWTQALLGLRAQEIHLCGEESIVPLVKKLCEAIDDEVTVHRYNRLTPLTISEKSLNGSYKNVKKGDCVVTFARKDIFEVKKAIERETGLKCAVVYGALPPESRALQAKAFNDAASNFDVLVASDAVGMGLNLNIKRIVFESVQKYDGKSFTFIHPPHLKQIAGRAGRFGTTYAVGEVTTFEQKDLTYVHEAMDTPTLFLKTAGIHPTLDIIEMFAAQMPDAPFSTVLQTFEDMATVSGKYFLCNYGDSKAIAESMDHLELSVRDRYQFVSAPTPLRDTACLQAVVDMATSFSKNEDINLKNLVKLPAVKESVTKTKLDQLESCHKIIMIYKWLSMRFPDNFVTSAEEAGELKEQCELQIDEALKKVHFRKRMNRTSFGQPKKEQVRLT